MAKPLYVLLSNNPRLILWEELNEELRHPNYQIPFFPPFFYMKKKGMPLDYSLQKTGMTIDPEAVIDRNWTLLYGDALLALESLLPFWLRPRRKLLWALL